MEKQLYFQKIITMSNSLSMRSKRTTLLADAQSHQSLTFGDGQLQTLRSARTKRTSLKTENFAQGILEHVRLAPKLSETVRGKLSLGAKILQLGGVEKAFKQLFGVTNGEKLLKASQCYLSTTSGPIAGLLFISNFKIAFFSERSLKIVSPAGKVLRVHYKVSIPLTNIRGANQSEDVKRSSQKYIQITTNDNFEFWFMGFLNLQKTLNYMGQALNGCLSKT